MAQENMQWKQFFDSKQAGELLKEKDALRELAHSEEIQGLAALLAAKGEQAQAASDAAIRGETQAFGQLLEEVACNPEGAEIIARLRERFDR